MVLTIIMKVLAALTTIYMILIFIRVMVGWFQGPFTGGTLDVLGTLTDPYLNYFSRFRIFRTERFDFSPIAALAILSVLNNIFVTVAYFGRITAGIVLGMILSSVWSAFAFLLVFFAVIVLVRFIVLVSAHDSIAPIWRTIDVIVKPVLYRVDRIFYRQRIVSFRQSLITSFCVLVAVRILGGLLVNFGVQLLERLPF
jgi:YggT family protein